LWSVCQKYAMDDLSACPKGTCISIAYEALVCRPAVVFTKILDFLGESMTDALRAYLTEEVTPAYVGKWRTLLDKGTEEHVLSFLEPTLSRVEKLIREQKGL